MVEFLHKKGFQVEDNPNTRISDEQYALLVKEFGKDLIDKEVTTSADERKANKENRFSSKKENENEIVEIKTEIPDEYKPKIVTKGHIDLDGNKKQDPAPSEQTDDSIEQSPIEPANEETEAKVVTTEEIPANTPETSTVMEKEESNRELLSVLDRLLKTDPVHTTLVDMTKLSLVEITRQKKEKPLLESMGRLKRTE